MTDYFNFLGLPLVVQDLITNEIVHNSIPEDRIQLALTSKYCNELVQRAKPKKIIDIFTILHHPRFPFTFFSNSRQYTKTKEQLTEILPNCQIKQVKLYDEKVLPSERYSAIRDMFFEAMRFATKLDIIPNDLDVKDEVVGFYVKLKHLKSVTVRNPEFILPYYPSKVELRFGLCDVPENCLEDLAVKSQKCPLSFFELLSIVSLEKCQQFLQKAKFSIGADICIHVTRVLVCLTYVDQNILTLEMFPKNSLPILISQNFGGKSRRILKLKRTTWLLGEIAFNVISASNPNTNYFFGVFKDDEEQMFINLENVDRDEILKVKFVDESIKRRGDDYHVRPIYSAKMVESAFPTANFTTPEERVEKINNVLGTNIQLIQVENFVQTVEVFRKTH